LFPAKGIGVFVVPMLASVPMPVLAQKIGFDVPEQPAVAGIPAFARQARIQIISPAGLNGLKTRSVKGRLTVDEGLRKLLRGTNLYVTLRTANAVSLAIRPVVLKPRPLPKPPRVFIVKKAPVISENDFQSDIVVTGTTAPQRRLDSGLAITSASLERIHEIAPNNTADLLKLAPGIWAETTGGATGANVFVRGFPTTGDAPFLTVQLDGAPIYPPTELAFSENTTLFRVDDMIEKVEILRGGTSPIFSNGQPGAIMNFIQRVGTANVGGGLRLTATDYETRRVDAYVTGPATPDTVFAVGGFYRISDGLRNTQFPADRGGQITGNMTHHFADGLFTAYVRYTRDQNAFYTGVPLLAVGQSGFSSLPGFNPLTDTLIGRDTQRLSIETGPGAFHSINQDEGRGLDLMLAGVSLDWSPNPRIQVTNRFNITKGDTNTVGLFTGPVPETLGQYISETITRANSDTRVVGAAGLSLSGQAAISATGMPISLDRYVLTAGLWSIKQNIVAFTNEFRVSGTVSGGHKLTGGLYISHYGANVEQLLGNNLLLLAEPNARRLDLVLNNGVQATRNGFTSATTRQIVGTSASNNIAVFVSDEWTLSRRTSVDIGVRFEHQALRGKLRDVLADADFDGNPLTLYNNNGALLLPGSTRISDNADRISASAGMIHRLITDRLTLHTRFNHGSNLPSFDKLRVGGPRRQSANVFEAGADLAVGPIRASVNAFTNHFTGLQFTRFLEKPDGSVGSILLQGGADSAGVEVETEFDATQRWNVRFQGTYEGSRYRGFGISTGNRVVRQPRVQFAASPSYTVNLASAKVKVHATYTYIGMRYSDVENLQRLPAYATGDAGIQAEWSSGLYADVVAQNLTNTFALTEGNTRVLGAALSPGPVIARPLFGRNISFSLGYRF
jgi:outer membrane receptor protein involved in Fe transport